MVIVGELVGVLLAAGQGVRFGSNKGLALLPDGMPMAVRSALNLRYAVSDVICVVRPGDAGLNSLLCENGFDVVAAEDAALGMSASLQAGINARPDAAGWMVALADMPLIGLDTYQHLVAVFVAEQRIVVPCLERKIHPNSPRHRFNKRSMQKEGDFQQAEAVAGRPPTLKQGERGGFKAVNKELFTGHPVTFPARYKPDLMALHGDKGAKAILQQHTADIQQVWVDDPGILQDFDTRQAFNRLFI